MLKYTHKLLISPNRYRFKGIPIKIPAEFFKVIAKLIMNFGQNAHDLE